MPQPAGVVSVQAVVPLGQQAPLPSRAKQEPMDAQVVPLPAYVERPKFVTTRPHPETIVMEQPPVLEQQAPVIQGFEVQVVPTPAKNWFVVTPQPAIVLIEQTPVVVQQEPVSAGQLAGQAAPSPW